MALMLNNTQENDERVIMKYDEVGASISSLVARLHRGEIQVTGSSKDRVDSLEKELRFFLTFLWDSASMGCHEHQEFQKLLPEFEAVANEVKSLLDSLLQQIDEDFVAVLNHIVLIRPQITKFLNLFPSIRKPVDCMAPMISELDLIPIVDSLTRDLDDMLKWEDNIVAGEAKGQIEVLYEGLILVKFSIKSIECLQHSEIRELKQPLLQIGRMALAAEYLLNSFSIGVAPLWYLSIRLTDINHEIQLLGAQLQQITEKCKSGGLEAAQYKFKWQPTLPAKRNTRADQVTVGFKVKEEEVLEKVVGEAMFLQVISIIGMPGLGKTTLAKKLYENSLVNYRFDKVLWCVVSQTYLMQSILIDILMQMDCELDKNTIFKMEDERLAERVYKLLKGKRYLIVMDDVWGSDVWDNFRRCFPDDGNGSRILITSRNKNAAPPNNIVYAMTSLSNDQCWELLEKKVFEDNGCPPQLLAIGKKIAANCSGLPLVVVVVAGILSITEREKTTWEQVEGNLASYIFDGGDHSVMQILELSYKHLPLHLKPCFLYLARYKEDKKIRARELMRLWIAEGFISKEKEKHAEDVAEEYLLELIDRSLVMVGKRRSDGGVKTCTVHDLFRDFCLKRCNEENFIMFGEKFYEKGGSSMRVVGGRINSSYCQHVRSIHGRISLPSDFDLRDLRLLRLLNFGCHLLVPRYTGIEYLVNLRYLIIDEGIYKTSIPPSSLFELIIGLVKLEHVFLETDGVVRLPPAIVRMKKLRFLQVNYDRARYDGDWNRSSHTSNLEYLSKVVIRNRNDEEGLRCTPHLRKLKCVPPKYAEKEKLEFRDFDLSFLTKLESLNVNCCVFGIWGIIYPANLKKLTLAGTGLSWDVISMIGRLENLVVLKLWRCMFHLSNAGDWDTRDGEFQKLRFLKLENMKGFFRWNVASSQHFPQLERLVLSDCKRLIEIPTEIGEIPTLQLVELRKRCSPSLVESAHEIQKQQLEMGNEDLRIINAVSW